MQILQIACHLLLWNLHSRVILIQHTVSVGGYMVKKMIEEQKKQMSGR